MAKKLAPKKASGGPETWSMKPIIATVRGSAGFKAWLKRAAKADRSTVAMFLERAAVRYAKELGFTDPPPER